MQTESRFTVAERCGCPAPHNIHYGEKGTNPSLKCNVCYPPIAVCGALLADEKTCGEIGCDVHSDWREMMADRRYEAGRVELYGG